MKTLLVTGSSGLIGSAVVSYFADEDWHVHGIDNNMRADFFGPGGDTTRNRQRLEDLHSRFRHHDIDIRDRKATMDLIRRTRPDAVVHAAAQPSHDLAAQRPFDDFEVNALGTLNMLEALRQHAPEAPFVFLSTNKVYGDAPNEIPLVELATRWDYRDPEHFAGIAESMRLDQSKHSLFGVSKASADLLVQEYGRYFGLRTCSLRGGCLTGPNHAGVELHGFLSYLTKVNLEGSVYHVFGYKGKQVRDNIHSADVAKLIGQIVLDPPSGDVYNIGGGRENSCSVLEAFSLIESVSGKPMHHDYTAKHREGDHICYITDLTKVRGRYPAWRIEKSLQDIFSELCASWRSRL